MVGLSGNSSGIGETEDLRFIPERIGAGGARLPALFWEGSGGGKSGIEGIELRDDAADFLNGSSLTEGTGSRSAG
jgi:hypothetical protein